MALPKVTEPIAGQWPVSVAWRGWLESLDRRLTILSNTETPAVTFPDPPQLVQGEGINVYGGIGWGQVATLSLRPLPDTGVGASLVKITRDEYGRVEGTEAATTDDLTEGAANLYHTDERAQDAVGAAIAAGTGNGATLAYDDAGNAINVTNTDKGSVAVATHEVAADPHPQYTTTAEAQAIADAKVQDSITDGVTDKAPSQNAVFDALAGKDDAGSAAAALTAANTYTDDSIAALQVSSGTWTPTLTNNTNLTSSTAAAGMYCRVGNVVNFSIRLTAQAASGSAGTPVATILEMSLPVPEDLVGVRELAGTAVIGESPYVGGQVTANTANDTANIVWFATSTSNRVITINGAYEITP